MPITHLVLDVDGTLVDSNDAHAHAWIDAMREAGYMVSFETVRRLIGMGGDKLLPAAIEIEKDTPTGQQIEQRRGEIFKSRYLPGLRPTPGAYDLVKYLHEHGFRMVVASSAKEDELEPLLNVAGVTEFIQAQTSSDDAEESKPAPDIVEAALGQLDVSPDEVVMLGDTPYDVEAAHRAGIPIIIVGTGGWQESEVQDSDAYYDSPAELLKLVAESMLMHP